MQPKKISLMSDAVFPSELEIFYLDRMSSTGYIKNTRAENSRIVNIDLLLLISRLI